MLLCSHGPHGLTPPQQDSGRSSAKLVLFIVLKFSSQIHYCTSLGRMKMSDPSTE